MPDTGFPSMVAQFTYRPHVPITHPVLSTLCVQLDSFNKANTRGTRRLSKLFSGRKSPKTPSPGGGSTPGGSAPATLTLEEMLLYQTVSLTSPCTALPGYAP